MFNGDLPRVGRLEISALMAIVERTGEENVENQNNLGRSWQ